MYPELWRALIYSPPLDHGAGRLMEDYSSASSDRMSASMSAWQDAHVFTCSSTHFSCFPPTVPSNTATRISGPPLRKLGQISRNPADKFVQQAAEPQRPEHIVIRVLRAVTAEPDCATAALVHRLPVPATALRPIHVITLVAFLKSNHLSPFQKEVNYFGPCVRPAFP